MSAYFLSKLSKPVLGWINQISGAAKNRCDAFAIALAYVIALRITMPIEAVTDPINYFRLNNTETVNRLIDNCNEVLPVNTKLVKQAIECFFLYRHHTQFPIAIPLALRKETALEDFFGMGKFFPESVLCTIKDSSEDITQFINQLTTLVAEIEKRNNWTVADEDKDHYVA